MESTRFPGKPLALLRGKPLIQWVWEAARDSERAQCVVIATDSSAVERAVWSRGGTVFPTEGAYRNGTERCAKCLDHLEKVDCIVNLQCDEPDITGADIDRLIESFENKSITLATMAFAGKITRDPNQVKVVTNAEGDAIYFSRAPLAGARVHVGIYAYRSYTLRDYAPRDAGPLELAENLEQLRVIECGTMMGYCGEPAAWKVLDIGRPVRSINTPADLEQFR